MAELVNSIGKEVFVGVIVSAILSFGGLLFKWLTGKRTTQSIVEPPRMQTYSSADTSNRAKWALGLGIVSYLMWFIPPLPILVPFTIAVSLWFGLTSRQHTSGKLGAGASCLHAILLGCGIVVLVAAMLTQSATNSNTYNSSMVCYDPYSAVYYYC